VADALLAALRTHRDRAMAEAMVGVGWDEGRVVRVPGLVIIAVVSSGVRDENVGEVALGLIRTRADLHRWGAANAHGRQMHEAVGLLRDAADSADPAALLAVVEKAVAAAVRVILRADDSSGIIGDAIRDLLELHVQVVSKARPSPSRLAAWMIKFQFDGTQDFFSIDVADYASVLGSDGLALYRAKLAEIAGGLGPEPADDVFGSAIPRAGRRRHRTGIRGSCWSTTPAGSRWWTATLT
jgi:hypothetical protein